MIQSVSAKGRARIFYLHLSGKAFIFVQLFFYMCKKQPAW